MSAFEATRRLKSQLPLTSNHTHMKTTPEPEDMWEKHVRETVEPKRFTKIVYDSTVLLKYATLM